MITLISRFQYQGGGDYEYDPGDGTPLHFVIIPVTPQYRKRLSQLRSAMKAGANYDIDSMAGKIDAVRYADEHDVTRALAKLGYDFDTVREILDVAYDNPAVVDGDVVAALPMNMCQITEATQIKIWKGAQNTHCMVTFFAPELTMNGIAGCCLPGTDLDAARYRPVQPVS